MENANTQAYLDLGDHKGETAVVSFDMKTGRAPSMWSEAPVAQIPDLYITRDTDGYSPVLLQYQGSPNPFEKARLNVYKTDREHGKNLIYGYIMSSAYVSSYRSNGKLDTVGISFGAIEINHDVYVEPADSTLDG